MTRDPATPASPPGSERPTPTVSVIVTTYNRPDVLRLAIASALRQTFTDFELQVVGDACDKATGEAMAEIDDPRVRYHNLQVNHGDQAEPSNAGFELTSGRFVAYLNHDDLWWPDHLELAVAALDGSDADGVFTLLDSARPDGGGELHGVTPGSVYHPLALVPASSWLLRRRLLADLGGWRPAGELYNIPSQDLLYRAWKAGKVLRQVPCLTVLACHSGYRPGVYLQPDREVTEWWERVRVDPERLRAERLTTLASVATLRLDQAGVAGAARHFLRLVARRLSLALRVHWLALGKFIRHRRRGGALRALRRKRGLAAETRASPPPEKPTFRRNDDTRD